MEYGTSSKRLNSQQRITVMVSVIVLVLMISGFFIASSFPLQSNLYSRIFPVDDSNAAVLPLTYFDDFAYPRGKNPAYGWIACGYAFPNGFSDVTYCVDGQYSLINDGYGNQSPGNFAKQFQILGQKNREKQFLPYLGWGPYRTDVNPSGIAQFPIDDFAKTQAFWDNRLASIKSEISKVGNTNDLFGFYASDEPLVVEELKYQYQAVKKHFPNAIVFSYGTTYGGPWSVLKSRMLYNDESKLTTSFGINGYKTMPYADVVGKAKYFTYSKIRYPEVISHGIIFYELKALVDGICTQYSNCRGQQSDEWSWKKQGKPVYFVPEAYRDACIISSSDPDRSTAKRTYEKITNEIVQGIAAGAQGTLAYEYGRFYSGTTQTKDCVYGMENMYDIYREIWPWIMAGNLERKSVTITSGMAQWTTPTTWQYETNHPTLTATQFDYQGKKMLVVVNLMSPSDYNNTINGTVSGLKNGIWEQLSLNYDTKSMEKKDVTITNGQVSVSFPPYGYAVYRQKGTTTVTSTPVPSPTSAASVTPSPRPSSTPTIAPTNTPSPTPVSNPKVVYDRWNQVQTTVNAKIEDLKNDSRFPASPSARSSLATFEAPYHLGDDTQNEYFGSRMQTVITAPTTGAYEFYLSADDTAELWLSTDQDPDNKIKIASINQWVNYRDLLCERSSNCAINSFKSEPINLTAGRSYYAEVVQLDSVREDHASVGWKKPGSAAVELIPSTVLSLPDNNPTPTATPTTTPGALNADINRDGVVNIFDLGILANNYGKTITSTSSTLERASDINQDNRVDIFDLGVLVGKYERL